jgi:hypothetical protein
MAMSKDERVYLRLDEGRKRKLRWYSVLFGIPMSEVLIHYLDALPEPKMDAQKHENSKDKG